jgi:DNA polymerase III subunit delta
MEHVDERKSLKIVLRDIAKGNIAPCYLLYGEEDYLMEDALNRILDVLLPEKDRELNLFWVDGENEDVSSICESICTPPLIPGRKVLVVKKTRLFQAKASSQDFVRKVVELVDDDLPVAARFFMNILDTAGWTLEDLRDGGWRRIPDADWVRVLGGDAFLADREKWLSSVIDYCTTNHMIDKAPSGGNITDLEKLLTGILPEGHCVIFTADSVDRRKKLFKIVSEKGMVLNFSEARSEAAKKTMMMEAAHEFLEKKGKKLPPAAWAALGEKTGFKLRESMEALELLVTYTGERSVIDEKDLKDIIGKTSEDSVFDLTSALLEKNLGNALSSLQDLLDHGVHPLMILAMIGREVRLLLHGKIFLFSEKLEAFRPDMDYNRFQRTVYPAFKKRAAGPELKGSGLAEQHPYVIYNSLIHAEKFSYERLIQEMERLVDIDVAMKSTGVPPRYMLERLVMDLCR